MNKIIISLTYITKFLNWWMFKIPAKFNIIATFGHFGILYLLFGTADLNEIDPLIRENLISNTLICILICIPALWGFFSFISSDYP